MKNRFLALLICAILVFSIIPFGKNIKASQTNNNAKQLNTPEQMAAVMREKANNNIARMKGKITQSQVNATIKQKLIVKTKDEIENTYGATVCTTTQWEITRFCFMTLQKKQRMHVRS